ncbi:MAG: hypothetical protein ABSG12_05800 [Steroidobacteraceae bacterium]|jgi:hypothetical protein
MLPVPVVVFAVTPDELEPLDAPPELLEPDELEPLEEPLLEEPPELELDAALALISTAAVAGEPKLAWPATLVSAKAKYLLLARLVTGTLTVLPLESPFSQVTVPLVGL